MTNGLMTVLVENTAGGKGLLAEHGLAFWIQTDGGAVLFDTGQGHVLAHNANRLGIPLSTVRKVVLSHGHYDHTGGLGALLSMAGGLKVFTHPAAFETKFACSPDGTPRDVAMPAGVRQALRDKAEVVDTTGPTPVAEGLTVTGQIPRVTDFEDVGGPFFKDRACRQPDDLLDDQAVFGDTPAGIMVILGCAHAGVINTLLYVRQLTDNRPIHTVIGGMHLVSADKTRMDETVDELKRLDIRRLLPAHCTGLAAMARLWREFPGRCSACPVGTVIELKG